MRSAIAKFKMAARRSTRERRRPHYFYIEHHIQKRKERKTYVDKNYYDIEIKEVDAKNNRMKIHFKGYDEKYDEWRDLDSDDTENFPVVHFHRVLNGDGGSLAERFFLVLERLRLEIKRNLKSGRKDDPNVRITLEIQADVFNMLVEKHSWKKVKEKGRISYDLDSIVSLDHLLGERWSSRVSNVQGDFDYVCEKTARVWLMQRQPLSDCNVIGGRFFPVKYEQLPLLVFTFVRGRGNSRVYKELYGL